MDGEILASTSDPLFDRIFYSPQSLTQADSWSRVTRCIEDSKLRREGEQAFEEEGRSPLNRSILLANTFSPLYVTGPLV